MDVPTAVWVCGNRVICQRFKDRISEHLPRRRKRACALKSQVWSWYIRLRRGWRRCDSRPSTRRRSAILKTRFFRILPPEADFLPTKKNLRHRKCGSVSNSIRRWFSSRWNIGYWFNMFSKRVMSNSINFMSRRTTITNVSRCLPSAHSTISLFDITVLPRPPLAITTILLVLSDLEIRSTNSRNSSDCFCFISWIGRLGPTSYTLVSSSAQSSVLALECWGLSGFDGRLLRSCSSFSNFCFC